MKWVALFSHTGSEIANVSKILNRWPDKIVTNNQPGASHINKQLLKHTKKIFYSREKPTVQDYNSFLNDATLVTLHGWMRVIPGSVCNNYDIYNLHPGLITKYPELKGKDPQAKVFESINTYANVGCVIHRAVAEVDAGDVLMERSTFNHYYGVDDLSSRLHEMATDMWVDFLQDKL